MPRPTVLLFDIDGTLVTTGGAGRRAMSRAFADLCQRADACDSFRLDGMTDRGIVRKALTAIGDDVTEARIDAVLNRYLECLGDEVSAVDAALYRVYPGMREAVDRACERNHIAVGLGTGNVKRGAKLKLDRVRLFDRFSFGGFGCDHEDRTALIRRGAERGAEKLGAPFEACRVVIIGDTPRDVAAAHGIGGECIGVATGHYSVEELRAAGAKHAFADLTVAGAMEALLDGPV
jgi:phosphoglycolate phosphatase